MAIGDMVSKVLVEFKGDTSDLKAKMRDLQGEEKRLADTQLKGIEARNKGLESQIATIGKMGGYAAMAAAAVTTAFVAMEKAAERERLAAQAGKVDLDRLAESAGKTKTQFQLLADTAKIQSGVYKLTQSQLEMVQQAMRQLTRETGNADEVSKKVTESIVKLEGEALKDYGIRVREAHTDSQKFAAIMDALAQKSGQLTDKNQTTAESIAGIKVSFNDAIDKVLVGLGKLVIGLKPVLDALGTAAGVVGDIVGYALDAPNRVKRVSMRVWNEGNEFMAGGPAEISPLEDLVRYNAVREGRLQSGNRLVGNLGNVGSGDYAWQMPGEATRNVWEKGGDLSQEDANALLRKTLAQLQDKANPWSLEERKTRAEEVFEKWEKAEEKWKNSPEGKAWLAYMSMGRVTEKAVASMRGQEATDRLLAQLESEEAGRVSDERFAGLGGERSRLRGALDEANYERYQTEFQTWNWNERMKAIRGEKGRAGSGIEAVQKSQLAQIFGPIQEFDLYAKGFQLLTGAAQSAFNAWIDGSMSAGDAIKKFFAESLKGQAVDLAGRAITHGAYAIGMLAFGDLAAAAMHGKAAATAAAGAVALGGLAKALTPSGGGAPSTAGAGSGGGGRSLSEAGFIGTHQRGSTEVIVVGDPHAMDSPRTRAANLRKMAKYAGLTAENGVALR